jgi:hypothetical protein
MEGSLLSGFCREFNRSLQHGPKFIGKRFKPKVFLARWFKRNAILFKYD